MNRGKILDAWRQKRAAGTLLQSGVDFIATSTVEISGLLPLGDANALSLRRATERVAGADGIPVLAGVCATDPLRLMETFLQEVKAAGAAGVQNLPSVGLIDGSFRKTLEESRLGYAREVEMIGLASRMDLVAAAVAFSPEEARQMAEAGADVVIAHPVHGPKKAVAEIAAAAREARKGILVLAFGSASDGVDGIQSGT